MVILLDVNCGKNSWKAWHCIMYHWTGLAVLWLHFRSDADNCPGTSATKLHAVLSVSDCSSPMMESENAWTTPYPFKLVIPTIVNPACCIIYWFSCEGFAGAQIFQQLLGLRILQLRQAVSSLQVAGGSGPVGAASIGGWKVSGNEMSLGFELAGFPRTGTDIQEWLIVRDHG